MRGEAENALEKRERTGYKIGGRPRTRTYFELRRSKQHSLEPCDNPSCGNFENNDVQNLLDLKFQSCATSSVVVTSSRILLMCDSAQVNNSKMTSSYRRTPRSLTDDDDYDIEFADCASAARARRYDNWQSSSSSCFLGKRLSGDSPRVFLRCPADDSGSLRAIWWHACLHC